MQRVVGTVLICLSCSVLLITLGVSQEAPPAAGEGAVVAVIPVEGMVDYGLVKFIERGLGKARETGATHVILQLDTPGGFVDSGKTIHHLLIDATDMETIAYVTEEALSAGAMIALSCNRLVMREGTRIGDVQPLLALPWGEPKGLGELAEKMETDLRAIFRTNAQRNGYPERLSEAMVTAGLEVLRVTMADGTEKYMNADEFEGLSEEERAQVVRKEIILPEGQLLTMTSKEAKELGFADAVVKDRAELLRFYGLEQAKIVKVGPTWSEELGGLLQTYGFIFLGLGLLGIYIEIKTPGFGAPGILGITCIVIFLFGKYVVGLAEAVELLFFVVGFALLAVELFLIPGFGIVGILGILCILIGVYLTSLPFLVPRELPDFKRLTTWAWQFSAAIGSVVVVGAIIARYLPKAGLPGKLMIRAAEKVSEGYVVGRLEEEGLEGAEGVSLTKLRPAGKAKIGERFLDVVADGEFIDKGERVIVVAARGNRVMVRKA